jgi:arylsulfatase A-like enzyme
VIDAPVMSIDVMPTVLSLLGAKYSPRDYHGSDIFTLGTTPRKVFALAVELFTKTPIRRAVIDGRLKFVQSDESGQGALYDLESDPDELHNLLPMPDHRADASRLRQEIGIWYETFDNLTADSPQLTPAQLERLKSLGYIPK